METFANFDMEDYWNEFKTVRGRRSEMRSSVSEEDCRSHEDGIEFDDSFLEAVLLDGWEQDKEVNEGELANSKVYNTLTPRQKAQVVKRTQERNLTLRQKRLKGKANPKPDVWSVFSTTDNSSTGTRSRSATPDSLDSISPPRTPPDPNPKNWVEPHLSRSRASLDSGHHSLIISPQNFSPVSPPSVSPHHSGGHLSGTESNGGGRLSPPDIPNHVEKYYYGKEENEDNERIIYHTPSMDELPKTSTSENHKDTHVRRQTSYSKDLTREVKQYYVNKGQYEINPKLYHEFEVPDVLGLRYTQIGSIHIKNNKNKGKTDLLKEDGVFQDKIIRRTQSHKHHPRDPFDPEKGSQPMVSYEGEPKDGLRNTNSTDLGFKILRGEKATEFPELVIEVGRSGQTKIDWLHPNDVAALSSLAVLELDIIFSENGINHSWRKRNKKRKSKEGEHGVFGISLEALKDRDAAFQLDPFTESNVPLILYKLIKHLEVRGLREEGLLRIPGHRSRTEELRKALDQNFYEYPEFADSALRKASSNELAALIKLFLRELPQPLLTYSFASAFYKTHRIENLGERIIALTMLVLLLPPTHRDTLKAILELCRKVIANENENKMGLYNVAMIIAPNIFLPSLPKAKLLSRNEDKEQQLNTEMEYARATTRLTQVLIKYREIIWTIPNRLIAQVRRQYEASLKPSSFKPIHRLLSKRNKDFIQRPIANEVEYQNGVLRISAPQFNKINHPVKLDWKMTARDIVARFIEDKTNVGDNPHRVVGRRELQQHNPSGNSSLSSHLGGAYSYKFLQPSVTMTTCLLRGSLRHALENHALHERGGNITERRVDPNAYLIAIYQDNPNGEFVIKCHHPGGQLE